MNYQLALTAGFCLMLVTTLAHAQRPEPLMPVGDRAADAAGLETPHPVSATASRLMLDLPVTGIDPVRIDYAKLPRVPCQAAVISDGFGWIARGLWVRDGQLLALASHFNSPGYPGKGLNLEAFRWDEPSGTWQAHGTVLDDTLKISRPKGYPQTSG